MGARYRGAPATTCSAVAPVDEVRPADPGEGPHQEERRTEVGERSTGSVVVRRDAPPRRPSREDTVTRPDPHDGEELDGSLIHIELLEWEVAV